MMRLQIFNINQPFYFCSFFTQIFFIYATVCSTTIRLLLRAVLITLVTRKRSQEAYSYYSYHEYTYTPTHIHTYMKISKPDCLPQTCQHQQPNYLQFLIFPILAFSGKKGLGTKIGCRNFAHYD